MVAPDESTQNVQVRPPKKQETPAELAVKVGGMSQNFPRFQRGTA